MTAATATATRKPDANGFYNHAVAVAFAATDAGSGVDPGSLTAVVDGTQVPFSYAHSIVTLQTTTLAPGTHRVTLVAADYQETKNMEDVGPVLPNTPVFHATVTVAP